ncbi:MAG: DegV family protein [Ruminococcaceae bacterium]|nr:DegV family protein [Oscillospiraceae bacterium]
MSNNIKITCDSTCDLPHELYAKYDVEVVALAVTLGDTLHRDGVDITAPELFAYVKESGTLPKTSAISMGEYLDVFGKYVKEGRTVIHINLSSNLSSSHQNAVLAAQELGNVYVVDSRNLSSGSGHLVIEAAEMAAQGLDAETIVARLNEMKERLDVSFVLQTLEYLQKGGRCSSVAALGARALQLRPEIRVADGGMGVGKKYRGSMEKSVLDYVRGRLEGRDDIDTHRIFVTHSPMDQAVVDKAIALVRQLHPFDEVIETSAGCTICSHCGPNCLGVLFFKKA